ncbi:MAG: hypothetical protein JW715_11215 [Sedimentisphaerales bacterium]|nr:hypothetical protein [Sedimentisphaerales bacterium]
MENDISQRKKSIAVLSLGLLIVAICLALIEAAGTIATKGCFETTMIEMAEQELPLLTKLVISISNVTYGIIFAAFVLILILKEIFIRAKRVTLAVNIVATILAIAYILVYIMAIFLPMIEIITQLENN